VNVMGLEGQEWPLSLNYHKSMLADSLVFGMLS
jgi:hypothetical protein